MNTDDKVIREVNKLRRNLTRNKRILCCGIKKLERSKFKTNYVNFLNKIRDGGLFGSTFEPNYELLETYPSDWFRYCIENFSHSRIFDDTNERNSFFCKYGVSFRLKKKARILDIQTYQDYKNIPEKFFTYGYFGIVELDFSKIRKEYDCFHLSEEAFWNLRDKYDFPESSDLQDFNSYDAETWIILNFDCINLESARLEVFDENNPFFK